jgi:hypothetical protein
MTIYILDNDAKKIAESLDDRSLEKMTRDIAYVLCAVHWEENKDLFNEEIISFLGTQKILGWTPWVLECMENYLYFLSLFDCCLNELYIRNLRGVLRTSLGDIHFILFVAVGCRGDSFLPNNGGVQTPFPLVMPESHKITAFEDDYNFCVVMSYRNHYQIKLKRRIEAHKEANNASFMLVKGKSFEEVNWTNRKAPEWLVI